MIIGKSKPTIHLNFAHNIYFDVNTKNNIRSEFANFQSKILMRLIQIKTIKNKLFNKMVKISV